MCAQNWILAFQKKAEYFVNNWTIVSFSWETSVTWVIQQYQFWNFAFLRNNSTFAHKYYLLVGISSDLIKYYTIIFSSTYSWFLHKNSSFQIQYYFIKRMFFVCWYPSFPSALYVFCIMCLNLTHVDVIIPILLPSFRSHVSCGALLDWLNSICVVCHWRPLPAHVPQFSNNR
jgi:hypothetical protein